MKAPTYVKIILAAAALIGVFVAPDYRLFFLGIFSGFVVTILLDFEI